MAAKILVVDDIKSVRESLSKTLAHSGFAVVTAANGSDGLAVAREIIPDLVLTDAEMPGLDGHSLCRVLKREPSTSGLPVIIMSGEMVEERDIVAGLDGGADDYIIKPFPVKVLVSRIKAVMRRYAKSPEKLKKLQKCGIELDPSAREARLRGKKIELTRKEFDLLALFIEEPNRVLPVNFLLETVWGYDPAVYNDPHTVETLISRLRKKLGQEISKRIVNSHRMGYKFEI